ncbi:MAG: mucoidy inhibitor MuiA family protein, partial [Sandaracinaceae bacterium]|nr:mucoidy inhibitor MuiA family protein [Sandaracinaceae bacterium]
RRLASLESSAREVDADVARLAAIGTLALGDTILDAAHGLGDVALWRARLDALDDKARASREERLSLEARIADTQAELAAHERRLAVEQRVTARERATLWLSVARSTGSADVEIELEYSVANACWRPLHRAELTDEETASVGSLAFRTDGCVWQRTGEAWPDVSLVFSTERSAREASPPLLQTDRLGVRRRATTTAVSVRQEEIATTGEGMASGSASADLPGVDDGGSAQRLVADGRVTVQSDGLPHRATIGSFQTRAELSLRAVPEVIAAVLRRSLQSNDSPRPLLAGPVELVRNGGFVGRTAMKFIAPGERFELGWGPEGALRLVREETSREGDPGLLSSQRLRLVDRTLRLSNLGPTPLSLEILERIPVSELEKVKVALDPKRSHKGATADEDGMVRLPLTLPARGTATVTLGFELRAAADVVGLPY